MNTFKVFLVLFVCLLMTSCSNHPTEGDIYVALEGSKLHFVDENTFHHFAHDGDKMVGTYELNGQILILKFPMKYWLGRGGFGDRKIECVVDGNKITLPAQDGYFYRSGALFVLTD